MRSVTAVTIFERIESLEEHLRQLKARQQRLEAQQRIVAQRRERREQTRRKILVGAVVLARIEQSLLKESELHSWLDRALICAEDRALFDLPYL
jgi:hypothetical protein